MKRDGGPAFPTADNDAMTLREYFAVHCPEFSHEGLTWNEVAVIQYAYADAMLAERERE